MRDSWMSDPNGVALVVRDVQRKLGIDTPKRGDGVSIGVQNIEGLPTRFDWPRWDVRAADIGGRAFWLGLALAGVVLGAPWLDRAAARAGVPASSARRQSPGLRLGWLDRLLSPLRRTALGGLYAAELSLVLRQRRRWWWLALLVAFVLQVFAAPKGLLAGVLLAWLLPLDIHSRSALRERESDTAALLFTAVGIRWRLLSVRIAVGLTPAWAATLPAMLRLSEDAPMAALATLVCGASVALWGLASATVARSPRLYELAMLLLAYVSIQGALALNPLDDPLTTLGWHAALLPAALLALAVGWPRLARAG